MKPAWVVVDGYCAAVLNDKGERIAFIEKTPRVRVSGPGTYNDGEHNREACEGPPGEWWVYGNKGRGCSSDDNPEIEDAYGFYPPSRAWCEKMLDAKPLRWVINRERENFGLAGGAFKRVEVQVLHAPMFQRLRFDKDRNGVEIFCDVESLKQRHGWWPTQVDALYVPLVHGCVQGQHDRLVVHFTKSDEFWVKINRKWYALEKR
jgi:hypothetical protein